MKTLNSNTAFISVFLAGLLFLAYGLFRGEAEVVLRKAVTVCLECIGIG
jgi:hypothetical protein